MEETPRPPYDPDRGSDGWIGEAHCYIFIYAWWEAIGKEKDIDEPNWHNKYEESKVKGRPDIDLEKKGRFIKRLEVERYGSIEREKKELEEDKRISFVAKKVDDQCKKKHKGEIVLYCLVKRDASMIYFLSMKKIKEIGELEERIVYGRLERFYMVNLKDVNQQKLRDAEFLGKERFDAHYKSLCESKAD